MYDHKISDAELLEILEGDLKKAKSFFAEQNQNALYAYADYMDAYLNEKRINRCAVAELAGFERSFGCKILGGRRNNTQNQIIRLNIAAGMNLVAMNETLNCHDLHPLDAQTWRDRIIMLGIKHGKDMYTINQWLVIAGKEPLFQKYKKHNHKV